MDVRKNVDNKKKRVYDFEGPISLVENEKRFFCIRVNVDYVFTNHKL